MVLEVQMQALMAAEAEFEHYARQASMIMDEVRSVRHHISDMSCMDYPMVRLRKTEAALDESRYSFRQFGETLEYASRHYTSAERNIENRTPSSISIARSVLERLQILHPLIPFAPLLPFSLRIRIWNILLHRIPRFITGWIPIWIAPRIVPYRHIPYPIPRPILYRPPKPHVLRMVICSSDAHTAARYINRIDMG